MALPKAYENLRPGRPLSARQQSPQVGSYDQRVASGTLLNQLFDKPRGKEPADIEAYKALMAQPGEEVHHQNILETIAPAYRGLNEQEAAEVTNTLKARGYKLGNELLNLINMPLPAHKDIHKVTKALGAEADLNRGKFVGKIDSALQDMIDSGDVPSTRYRADMIGRYLDKFGPILREAQDEVLTNYYTQSPEKAQELLKIYIDDVVQNRLT